MKTIKNILLCAPFFGLFAVALPGCSDEPDEQPSVETAPLEVICDKVAECGKLDEGVTVEQCAAKLGPALDPLKQDDVCGPIIERWESFTACTAQHSTCEDLESDEDVTKDHPCFEESESFQQAMAEADKKKPDSSFGCILAAMFAADAATSPPSGSE